MSNSSLARVMKRKRMLWSGLLSLGLVVTATSAVRGARRSRERDRELVDLPKASQLATETAVSVHNSAKSKVLRATRMADHPDETLILDTVRRAMRDGAAAGADVAAVTIGAIEGVAAATSLVDSDPETLVADAAVAAYEQAQDQGEVAAARVHDLLAPYLPTA